jgi:serine/threonine-protein phosphatase 2A activator
VAGSSRFGNPAFKAWHGKLSDCVCDLVADVVPDGKNPAVIELTPYLLDSFGNATRIDYGSGHELAFVAFLCCLGLLDAFGPDDMASVVLVVFRRYLALVRKIQMTYKQEPAGSHGVWGLDDHQFLCYYWGAAQLIGNVQGLTPADIIVESSVRDNADQHLFFGAVAHIRVVKSGPFHEHSRYLYDMSAVPNWGKINSGLLKMFDAEVLFKVPVIQHFLFGSLLPLRLPPRGHAVSNDSTGVLGGVPGNAGAMPPTAAPWARKGGGGAQPPTAAPWAKGAGTMPPPKGGTGGMMPPTAAPWAKKPRAKSPPP